MSTLTSAQARLRLPSSLRSLLTLLLLLSLMPCAFAQNSAAFVSQSVPTAMQSGGTYSASVTIKNTGNTAWTGGSCSLASANTQTWGTTQVSSPLAVAPGGQITFAFLVQAPRAGSYSFSWNMTQGGSTLISGTPAVAVTVTDPTGPFQNTAIIQGTSASVPSFYTPGSGTISHAWEVDGPGGVVATSASPNGWSVGPNSPQQLGIFAPAGAVVGGGYVAFQGVYTRPRNPDNPWEYNANFSVVGPPSAGAVGPLGPAYPWQAEVGGVNTANGNKLFSVPIVGWPVRGGMSVGVTLYQNSESTVTFPTHIGSKWSCNYDAWLTQAGSGPVTVQWGDGQSYSFAPDGYGGFNPPKGIYDKLSPSGSDYNLSPSRKSITTSSPGQPAAASPPTTWTASPMSMATGSPSTATTAVRAFRPCKGQPGGR